MQLPQSQGLYDPANEHDACGVGFVAHIKNVKSHEHRQPGLQILENLTHRGAVGYDPLLGDGAGILIQIPDASSARSWPTQGVTLPAVGDYGVGMLFLPRDANSRARLRKDHRSTRSRPKARPAGLARCAGRQHAASAQASKDSRTGGAPGVHRPRQQGRRSGCLRAQAVRHPQDASNTRSVRCPSGHGKDFYIPSMSSRTLVYKGMLLADQVGKYFLDLQDERLVSALALVHQRFSTNTFPTWDLAHPFRMIAHNGEINTLRGNVNWMAARQQAMSSKFLGEDLDKLWPLIVEGQSDSACFDNALELLVMGGYSLPHAMMLLIPEAWAGNPLMDEERRAFYEYHAALMEPWDGPAAVAFTDGRMIGATLDRNGLRPARYLITDDDVVLMASEMGVLTYPARARSSRSGACSRARCSSSTWKQGRIVDDAELKQQLATAKPYRKWIEQSRYILDDLPDGQGRKTEAQGSLLDAQQAFGYTQEDLKFIMMPMAAAGEEATGSMGNDAALPVLSNKQQVAVQLLQAAVRAGDQSADRPDPRRDRDVADLLHRPQAQPARRRRQRSPRRAWKCISRCCRMKTAPSCATSTSSPRATSNRMVLDITYPVDERRGGLRGRHRGAVRGSRQGGGGRLQRPDPVRPRRRRDKRVAIPALLACSACIIIWCKNGLRTSTGLVVETGSAREVHHFALLAGYGAEAVYPWLAYRQPRRRWNCPRA